MSKKHNIICPDYLCYNTLPYSADIFYHEKLVYSLPTGITPNEWENVLEFPQFCAKNNVELPQIIWEMQGKYFECSKQAVECSKILEPLGKKILKNVMVYPRDIKAISKSRSVLNNNPNIFQHFLESADDFNFLSREVFSHIFLEVYLEGGFALIIDYLENNFNNQEKILELLAAVVLNRVKILFNREDMNCIVYNHSWYPFLKECFSDTNCDKVSETFNYLDPNVYRLFCEIVTPIFGRCDSNRKTEYVAVVAEKQKDAIVELKNICQEIIETSMFYRNNEIDLRDKKFKSLVVQKVIEPLSYMMSKPKNDVKQILSDFILDSTVIGGSLSIIQGFDSTAVELSAAAGFISAGLKYIINEEKVEKSKPEKFLLQGLKKNKLNYLQYENILHQIGFN